MLKINMREFPQSFVGFVKWLLISRWRSMENDDWNCDGVYLPSGVQVAGLAFGDTQGQQLTEPVALKIVSGTQLVAKTNPETGAIELSVPPAQVFKTGEGNWAIPALSSADIEAQTPNAPLMIKFHTTKLFCVFFRCHVVGET